MSIANVAIRQDESAFIGNFGPHRIEEESITVFLTVSGSVIPMRLSESDSIASVKLRIQNCKGFVAKKQKLVLRGRELARNDSLVRDYGIADGSVLHLVLRLSDLQSVCITTVCGKQFKFQVERSRNIHYLKQQIAQKGGQDFEHVQDQQLICNGETLDDQRLIDDISTNDNADVVLHLLVRKTAKVRAKHVDKAFQLTIVAPTTSSQRDFDGTHHPSVPSTKIHDKSFFLEPIVVNPKTDLPSGIIHMIESTSEGLEGGYQPIRSTEGSGGAYLMRDVSGDKFVSVFKPIDEEPNAVNNPRCLPFSSDGEGLKKGTRVGEGALREVAAYILDHPKAGRRYFSNQEMGFAGVPPTAMIKCLHPGFNHPQGYEHLTRNIKIGSLQKFVQNYGSCEDMGPQAFPVEEVHKISVLDIRLANADRHAGNILITKHGDEGRTVLIPIDHGYCLPENFEDCTFDWLDWPQAQQPYSPDTVDFIRSLDAEEDIALLEFHGWKLPHDCARNLRISTMLLKKGAERGLTPFTIGNIMCRETLKKESIIEEIVREAEDSVLPETSEDGFLEAISQIMDRQLDKLSMLKQGMMLVNVGVCVRHGTYVFVCMEDGPIPIGGMEF